MDFFRSFSTSQSDSSKEVITCASCSERQPRPENGVCRKCKNILPRQSVSKQKSLTYMATIPLGVLPGQSFVAVLDGERKVFVCPQGARPGSKVQVEGPSVSQQQSSKRK